MLVAVALVVMVVVVVGIVVTGWSYLQIIYNVQGCFFTFIPLFVCVSVFVMTSSWSSWLQEERTVHCSGAVLFRFYS